MAAPSPFRETAGYKNTKCLTRVVFMPQRNGGYWSDKGYEWYGGT
jgi:DMSO/TMAO reductase YedYZ molybdopterin-dependent catalytic subunit